MGHRSREIFPASAWMPIAYAQTAFVDGHVNHRPLFLLAKMVFHSVMLVIQRL
jgi:prepilin-type processing-associated H-X9-DG protein